MNILRGSIFYRGILKIALYLSHAYRNSKLNLLVKHLIAAHSNSVIMNWLLSRNAEKGVQQQSYTYGLLQSCIKTFAKLIAFLGKPFRATVDNGSITALINTTARSLSKAPLTLTGMLGFVFMLANLIFSVIIAKGFTYPGSVIRVALLLVFLLLIPMNVDGKSLKNGSVIFRFIKYMVD